MIAKTEIRESDALNQYLREALQYPRISREKEVELSRIILKSRNPVKVQNAVNELVLGNLRLVLHCLKDFTDFLSSSDVCLSRMDLIAEGNIALIAAAKGFNAAFPSFRKGCKEGSRFSTYACRCIRSRMLRTIKLGRLIRIPERHFAYRRKIDELENQIGDNASDSDIARQLGIGVNRLEMVRWGRHCKACRVEDMKSSEDSDLSIDSFPADAHNNPDREVQRKDLCEYLGSLLNRLPERTRMIISEMFLNTQHATLRELSARFRVSKERCRQICAAGLRQLRKAIETDVQGILGEFTPSDTTGEMAAAPMLAIHARSMLESMMNDSDALRDVA